MQVPRAMDVSGDHIILAGEPLEITVLRVSLAGALTPSATASATFQLVRQLSIVSPGHPLQARLPLLQPSLQRECACQQALQGPESARAWLRASCNLPSHIR